MFIIKCDKCLSSNCIDNDNKTDTTNTNIVRMEFDEDQFHLDHCRLISTMYFVMVGFRWQFMIIIATIVIILMLTRVMMMMTLMMMTRVMVMMMMMTVSKIWKLYISVSSWEKFTPHTVLPT